MLKWIFKPHQTDWGHLKFPAQVWIFMISSKSCWDSINPLLLSSRTGSLRGAGVIWSEIQHYDTSMDYFSSLQISHSKKESNPCAWHFSLYVLHLLLWEMAAGERKMIISWMLYVLCSYLDPMGEIALSQQQMKMYGRGRGTKGSKDKKQCIYP